MKRIGFLTGIVLTTFALGAYGSETFTCGQHVIETGVGTTKYEVLQKCGEPTEKTADRWYYANQTGGRTIVLVFQTDQLEQIETLSNE